MMLLYKDTFVLKDLIICNNNCIIARLQHKRSKHSLVVATVYIPPGDKNDKLLVDTMCIIDSLQMNEDLVIGGDFNARTSNRQAIPKDLNPYLLHRRTSTDKELSRRGKLLLRLLKTSNLMITNGRTHSDTLGSPTFINRNGCSVVDYVITDPSTALKILDFKVENAAVSDHQPITISFLPFHQHIDMNIETTPVRTILKWDEKKAAVFKSAMHKLVEPDTNATVDMQYNTLVNAITESARKAETVQTIRRNCSASQPYFDKQCLSLKKEVNNSLKQCKSAGFKEPQLSTFLYKKSKFAALIKAKKKNWG